MERAAQSEGEVGEQFLGCKLDRTCTGQDFIWPSRGHLPWGKLILELAQNWETMEFQLRIWTIHAKTQKGYAIE